MQKDPFETSNTNSNLVPETTDKPKTKEELKRQFRNIIVMGNKARFQPVSKTYNKETMNYQDTIKRKLLGAGINPQEFMKSDRRMLPKGDNALDTIDKFTPVYDLDYLARLQNAAEFDPTIKKAARVKSYYVMKRGKGLKQTMQMHTTQEFETKGEYDSYFNELFPDAEGRKNLFNYVDNVCIDSNIFQCLSEIYELSIYFGRAGAIKIFMDQKAIEERGWDQTKQYFDKTPILFQPLSPMLMGNVTVDKRTWLPTYLWYNDAIFGNGPDGKPKPSGWIVADRLIYMARRDIHLIPNKLRYGLSDLSPVLPISELARQLYSDVLGEAVSNMILPSLFLVFDSLDEKSMQEIIDRYQQGGIMGRNKDVSVEPMDFKVQLDPIINLMKSLNRMVYAALEVPYLFGGDEGEFNRSVAETVTDVWQKTVLDPERDIIQDIYDGQFTGPLVSDYMDKYYNGKSYDWHTERLRFVLKFPKIDFSNIFEKAQSLEILVNMGVVTRRQAQLMYDSESFPEEQTEDMIKLEKLVAKNPDMAATLLAYANRLKNPLITPEEANTSIEEDLAQSDRQEEQDMSRMMKANQEIDTVVRRNAARTAEKVANNNI